jgi:G:T-mismatch repair DNA endonuclease (very short patch repair protein)
MADVHDKKTRSYNLGRVKDKYAQLEILVIKFIFSPDITI